jgi:hypothetical protein
MEQPMNQGQFDRILVALNSIKESVDNLRIPDKESLVADARHKIVIAEAGCNWRDVPKDYPTGAIDDGSLDGLREIQCWRKGNNYHVFPDLEAAAKWAKMGIV